MKDVFARLDQVSFHLLEEEPFFGYFLLQLQREIREEFPAPTGSYLRQAQFHLVIQPLQFMKLSFAQQCGSIKHEILHLIANHHCRSRELLRLYPKLAVSLAMDICVNQHIDELPPFASTLKSVNAAYGLNLLPLGTLEGYTEAIAKVLGEKGQKTRQSGHAENDGQTEFLGITDETVSKQEQKKVKERFQTERSVGASVAVFEPEQAHDLWEQSDTIEDEVWQSLLERAVQTAAKGGRPLAVNALLKEWDGYRKVLAWQKYLKRMVGHIASKQRRVSTRRNRRQPERPDIRGVLRDHQPHILVAVDISASMEQAMYRAAMLEVWQIAKSSQVAVTVVECDDHIRRSYQVRRQKDILDRSFSHGQTRFSPVIAYANRERADLLVYFTDGKGEAELAVPPRGYPLLWILTDPKDRLSVRRAFGAVLHLAPQKKKEWADELDVPRGGYSMNAQEK
ncbi:MAG: VWA-like domain-containing protein [Lachnospiraceae bacterium]|nr:VWA-like domain-containing protein [Lachnospiraceae bacterium]MDY5741429.1 VWA-like domain-containing protein [Lachnospiraceae bacterium]